MNNVIKAFKNALEKMDKNYCRLTQGEYQERPICYEFYHQLRKLIEYGEIDLGVTVIQAEVDKTYQRYFPTGKKPDFILHVPDTDLNLAVIEFKRALTPILEVE